MGKVWSPKSFVEFEPEWSAVGNTLGHARESVIEVQSGEVTSPAATTKGWGCPLIIAPGQNDRVPLCLMRRMLPEETQATFSPSIAREGVSHGRGQKPSAVSIGECWRRRASQGAWPWGGTSTITFEICLGRYVGVGIASPSCMQIRVNSAS